jgi:PAS domain S-box-containing protein
MPDAATLKDIDGHYLAVNAVWCAIYERKPAEVIGKTDFDLFPLEQASQYKQRDEQVQQSLKPVCVEVEHKKSDGATIWLEVRKVPFHDNDNHYAGLVSIIRDITEKRNSQKRLELLTRAVEQSSASIMITDPQGAIEYVNPYFEKHTGYSYAEAKGQNPRILKGGDQPDSFYKELWTTISSGREWRGEFRNKKKDSSLYWEQASISAVRDDHGQIVNYVAVKEDITERKNAEKALELRESYFSGIIENQTGLVWLKDTAGRFLAVNRKFAESFGHSPEWFIGKTDFDFALRTYAERYDEQDKEVIETRSTLAIEEIIVVKGVSRLHETVKAPVFGQAGEIIGTTGYSCDITERKQVEDKLIQRESHFRAIIENQPGLVWLKDYDGRYLAANHSFAEACGHRTPANIAGLTDFDIWPRDLAEKYRADDKRVMETCTIFSIEELVQVGNERRSFETFKSPVINASGEVIGVSGYSHDITNRAREQKELIRAKDEAETANRAKSTFLATMSHELRTPLNVINGMSAVLAQENWPPEHKHAVDLIAQGGHTLLAIIEEILDYSGLQAGKIKLEEKPFAPLSVAADALRLCAPHAQSKRLNLTCWLDPKIPAEALGDPRRLQQVLVNLLHNAIKFTESGRVHLRVSVRSVTGDSYLIEFSILDSGIGISAENIEKLFLPFSQADDTITRRFGGTGLGLAITKSFADLMHGDIDVRSRLHLGSVFRFSLHLKATGNRATSFATLSVPSLRRRRVLILNETGAQHRLLMALLHAWDLSPIELTPIQTPAGITYPDVGYDIAILPVRPAAYPSHPLSAWLAQPGRGDTIPIVWLDCRDAAVPSACTARSVRLGTFIDPAELSQSLADLLTSGSSAPGHRAVKATKPKSLAEELPLSILAAEDNATNREVIKLVLGHLGYEVDLVENGAEAVLAVKNEKYGLLLLDMQMPVMDGLTAAREICRLIPDPTLRPKIVALTANALPGDRENCLAAGMDAYLSKPIIPVDLVACFRRIFIAGEKSAPVLNPPENTPAVSAERPWLDLIHLETITTGLTPDQRLDTLRQLHASVCNDYEQTLPLVVECCQQQDQPRFAETIHGLKGCFMMIGWSRVGTYCAESLALARKGGFKDWQGFPQNLQDSFNRSSEAMTVLLDERQSNIHESNTPSPVLSEIGGPLSP